LEADTRSTGQETTRLEAYRIRRFVTCSTHRSLSRSRWIQSTPHI